LNVAGAIHQAVQVQDPVLLGLEVRIARLLPGLQAWKRHAFLAEQEPEALVADVVDHPLSDQEVGQLGQAPGGERQVMVLGRDRVSCLIARRWARVKVGGRPCGSVGTGRRTHPGCRLCSTSRTRSGLVKVTWAIWATSMPWALSSTIWARRQVTTDPVDRCTMRSSRLPPWLLSSRTRTRSATLPPSRPSTPPGSLHHVVASGRAMSSTLCCCRHGPLAHVDDVLSQPGRTRIVRGSVLQLRKDLVQASAWPRPGQQN